jgi:hypothetical protein
MSGNALSSELPLARMSESEYFEAYTPRPGKSPKTSHESTPVPLKWRIPTRKPDKVSYHFNTNPAVKSAIQELQRTHSGLPERDALFLATTIQRNYVWVNILTKLSSDQFTSFVEGVREDITKCRLDIQMEMDLSKLQKLRGKLTHLQTLETKNEGVFAKVHPPSGKMFRDVLSPTTIRRPFGSINLLMEAISKDVVEFLTSPDKLENRKRVIEQIWTSKPK